MQRFSRYCVLVVSGLIWASSVSADVRILWDVSQSMVANDPNNRRNAALIRLIESLPESDRAAIWTFGQFVNLLVPHEPVNDRWRQQAISQVDGVQSVAVRTNMGAAFEQAAYDFNFSSYRGPIDVILVTDGQVDISPNPDVNAVERARILSTIVPRYRAANARIHTIAISSQADQSLLRQISEQTGGQFYAINNADGLASSLFAASQLNAPNEAITSEQVLASDVLQSQFSLAQTVRELTVIVEHQRGAIELRHPNGVETSAVNPGSDRWSVGPGFSQVTISNAASGDWRVSGESADIENILVYRDIRLVWLEPTNMTVANGDIVNITAALVDQDNQPITEFADRIGQMSLTVDGQPIAVSVVDGLIRARLLPQRNDQQLTLDLTVDVATFTRGIIGQLRYVDAFNEELLLTETAYEWRVYPNRSLLGDADLQLFATIRYREQETTERFQLSDFGYWAWQLPFDRSEGQYEIELSGTSTLLGVSSDVPTASITLTLPMDPSLADARTPGSIETTSNALSVPDLSQLEPELVVESNADWNDQPLAEEPANQGRSGWLYLLLSLPGVGVLVGAYLFYRRLESKAKASSSEDEMLLGGDEFTELDDIDNLGPDADLDIGNLDDDDMEPPIIDEQYDEDLPPPTVTEAPKANMEDLLEEVGTLDDDPEATDEVVESDDEELFDISSIDDDLADLDLALDGEDPFADETDEKP